MVYSIIRSQIQNGIVHLKKKEIISLYNKVKQKSFTIVPLSIILSDNGFIKIEIGLVKGKHTFDKRVSIKEKDIERDLKRNS